MPIAGAEMLIEHGPKLIGDTPNVFFLAVRLPPDLQNLTATIVGHVERDFGDFSK
jgi:hypothetical protein